MPSLNCTCPPSLFLSPPHVIYPHSVPSAPEKSMPQFYVSSALPHLNTFFKLNSSLKSNLCLILLS